METSTEDCASAFNESCMLTGRARFDLNTFALEAGFCRISIQARFTINVPIFHRAVEPIQVV